MEKRFFGIDENYPETAYKSIYLNVDAKKIVVPKNGYNSYFEPNLELTKAYFDKTTNRIYLTSTNGDGAGGYVVIWVFENEKFVLDLALLPF